MNALSQFKNWVSPPVDEQIASQISSWNQSYGSITGQVERLNRGLEKPEDGSAARLEAKELDEIYDIINSQFKKLKELELEIKAKLKDLTEGEVSYRGKEFKKVLGATLLTNTCTGAAFSLAFASSYIFPDKGEKCEEDPRAKILKSVAYALGLVGLLVEHYSRTKEVRLNYQQFQEDQLKEIAAEGVDRARLIKRFIKRFRDLRKPDLTSNVHVQNNFDVRISNCLTTYQNLPDQFRNADVYPRVVSLLIEKLPKDDPIHQQMNAASLAQRISLINDANNPLPLEYLPSIANSGEEQKWLSESAPLLGRPSLPHSPAALHPHHHLKDIIVKRFDLNPKHLPFIDTPKNLRINLEPENEPSVIIHSQP